MNTFQSKTYNLDAKEKASGKAFKDLSVAGQFIGKRGWFIIRLTIKKADVWVKITRFLTGTHLQSTW